MLGDKRGKQLRRYVPDYTIFDLETTGISTRKDEVVEISAVRVRSGRIVEEFTTLVNPGMPIPYYASQVNGITDDMVADAPEFKKALSDFIEFVGEDVLVGHNIAAFDMRFLYRDCGKYFGSQPGNDYIDTLVLAKELLPQISSRKLTALAGHYGISAEGAHRALNDCRMNQQVFERLGGEMELIRGLAEDGISSLTSRSESEAAFHNTLASKSRRCPRCGGFLKRRNGRFGEFFGCSGFPVCRYTENA